MAIGGSLSLSLSSLAMAELHEAHTPPLALMVD